MQCQGRGLARAINISSARLRLLLLAPAAVIRSTRGRRVVRIYTYMLILCGRAMWSGLSPGFCFFLLLILGTPDHRTAVKINLTPPRLRAPVTYMSRVYSICTYIYASTSSSFWKSARCFPKVSPGIPTIWRSEALRAFFDPRRPAPVSVRDVRINITCDVWYTFALQASTVTFYPTYACTIYYV